MGRVRARRKIGQPAVAAGANPQAAVAALPLGALWAAIGILTLLAYSNSFQAALSMDSPTIVERDSRIREASSENLGLIWSKNYWWPSRPSNLFRPVTTMSYLLNYAVLGGGASPTGYHVLNFLLHLLNAWLLYAVAWRITRDKAVGLIAAALFATHPIATEAVTNVVGRADLLAAAAVLGGLLLHIESTRRANPWPWRAALWLTTLAGVFAKEAAVVVLAAIVLYDVLIALPSPAERERDRVRAVPWPSYAGVAAVMAFMFVVRRNALADMGYYRDHFLDNPLFGVSFVAARLTALKVMAWQLVLLIAPLRLSSDYSYDQIPLFSWGGAVEDGKAIIGAVLIAAMVVGAFVLRRRQPAIAFFTLLYFAALLPTSNLLILIGSIMAERFLYLPSAAFAALLAIGIRGTASRLAAARPAGPPPERVAILLASVLALAYATRTYVRNDDWRNEETLFRATRVTSPRSYKAHKGVANALLAEKPTGARLDEAIAAGEESLRIIDAHALPAGDQPSDLMAALGLAYVMKGDELARGKTGPAMSAEAASWYRRAITILERAVETDRVVNARVRQLKIEAGAPAEEIFDVGLRRVHGTLGNARMRLGLYDSALESFAYLRRLDPSRPDGYTQSAWALAQAGRYDDAAAFLLAASIIGDVRDVAPLLQEVYQKIDPGLRPLRENGSPNLDESRVRGHLAEACAELVGGFARSNRRLAAGDLREICVGRYAMPPEPLDRLLAAP
jgi:tetratricopeptide (TPR) repeat protein